MKLRKHKGITLVALIITIVILLILAVVAINAIKGDGIIAHAKNAKTQYEEAQKNEQDLLSNYELMLAQETGNAWKQEKTKVTKGDITLNAGDTITNFTAGGKTWQVLGAENGKLLLTTSENVNELFEIKTREAGWSETEKRFVEAENALDEECKSKITLTEAEKKQVVELRSINVEDIDRITGYDKTKYEKGQIDQYGNKVTYSINSNGKVAYKSDIKSSDETSYTKLYLPNTSTNMTSPYTITSTSYWYCAETDTGMEQESNAYQMLFGYDDKMYWVASSFIDAGEGYVGFGMFNVENGCVDIFSTYLWQTFDNININDYSMGVRPVVSLASNIKLTKTGNSGEWNISE